MLNKYRALESWAYERLTTALLFTLFQFCFGVAAIGFIAVVITPPLLVFANWYITLWGFK